MYLSFITLVGIRILQNDCPPVGLSLFPFPISGFHIFVVLLQVFCAFPFIVFRDLVFCYGAQRFVSFFVLLKGRKFDSVYMGFVYFGILMEAQNMNMGKFDRV